MKYKFNASLIKKNKNHVHKARLVLLSLLKLKNSKIWQLKGGVFKK